MKFETLRWTWPIKSITRSILAPMIGQFQQRVKFHAEISLKDRLHDPILLTKFQHGILLRWNWPMKSVTWPILASLIGQYHRKVKFYTEMSSRDRLQSRHFDFLLYNFRPIFDLRSWTTSTTSDSPTKKMKIEFTRAIICSRNCVTLLRRNLDNHLLLQTNCRCQWLHKGAKKEI